MRTLRSTLALSALAAGLVPGIAAANEPTGEWLVEDKVAIIRIENCGGAMWGINAWEKEPGTDNGSDPKRRGKPTLGATIILGMKPATQANKWEGEIYNPENGKKYEASISLSSPDVLRVTGCVLGFLCGGQDWTRVVAPAPTAKPDPRAPKPKTAKEICASIPEAAPPPGAPAQTPAPPQKQAPKR